MKKAAAMGRFDMQSLQGYFGGGVVDSAPFLDFLPPLWPLVLVLLVAFFPEAVDVLAVLSVEPPVACANDRVAPSSSVNAIVSSFFISLLQRDSSFLESFNSCKELLCNILSREAGKKKAFPRSIKKRPAKGPLG